MSGLTAVALLLISIALFHFQYLLQRFCRLEVVAFVIGGGLLVFALLDFEHFLASVRSLILNMFCLEAGDRSGGCRSV